MLSTPVAGVTFLVATSEAATLQENQIHNIHLPRQKAYRLCRAGRCHQDRVRRPRAMLNGAIDERGRLGLAGVGNDKGVVITSSFSQ
jgi:hypothetical protein